MRLLKFTLSTVLLILSLSCTRKDSDSTTAKKETLLAYLPQSTVYFGYTNSSSTGYQKWKQSPWGELGSIFKDFSMKMARSSAQRSSGTLPGSIVLFEAINKSGLMPIGQNQPETVKEMLSFSNLNQSGAIETAFYFTASPNNDLKNKLNVIEEFLKSEGIQTTRGPNTLADNVVAVISSDTANRAQMPFSSPWDKAFIYATSDKLAIGSTQAITEQLFNNNPTSAFLNSPQYTTAEKYLVPDSGDAFASAYFDIKELLKSGSAFVPANQAAEFEKKIKEAPIGVAAGYFTMSENPTFNYSLSLTPTNDSQRQSVAALKQTSDLSSAKISPANTLFLIALDGAPLKAAKNSILSELSQEERAKTSKEMALLDSLENISIGIANASGASPFPEIFVTANSSNASELKAALMSIAQAGTSNSPMGGAGWQKMEIDGNTIDFTLTPLGIGMFIGATGKNVFISSSEAMTRSIIEANKDTSKALLSSVSALNKSQNGRILASYLNFAKLFDLIQTVQGSMAMFTGGQNTFDMKQFEILKKLGFATSEVVVYEDKIQSITNLKAQ